MTSFGAVGDGITDDTRAFTAAIDFNRGGDAGSNQDKQAAFIYVPAGTYLLSVSLARRIKKPARPLNEPTSTHPYSQP